MDNYNTMLIELSRRMNYIDNYNSNVNIEKRLSQINKITTWILFLMPLLLILLYYLFFLTKKLIQSTGFNFSYYRKFLDKRHNIFNLFLYFGIFIFGFFFLFLWQIPIYNIELIEHKDFSCCNGNLLDYVNIKHICSNLTIMTVNKLSMEQLLICLENAMDEKNLKNGRQINYRNYELNGIEFPDLKNIKQYSDAQCCVCFERKYIPKINQNILELYFFFVFMKSLYCLFFLKKRIWKPKHYLFFTLITIIIFFSLFLYENAIYFTDPYFVSSPYHFYENKIDKCKMIYKSIIKQRISYVIISFYSFLELLFGLVYYFQ